MAPLAIDRWRESRILAGRYRTIAFKVPRTVKLTAIHGQLRRVARGSGPLYRDALWGWLLSLVVAGGAHVMYIVSCSVGLPGFEQAIGRWFGPLGIVSLIVAALFIALFHLAVITRG